MDRRGESREPCENAGAWPCDECHTIAEGTEEHLKLRNQDGTRSGKHGMTLCNGCRFKKNQEHWCTRNDESVKELLAGLSDKVCRRTMEDHEITRRKLVELSTRLNKFRDHPTMLVHLLEECGQLMGEALEDTRKREAVLQAVITAEGGSRVRQCL